MGNEIDKKVFIGDTGNRAEVSEQRLSPHSLEGGHAKVLVRQAGELHRPLGAKYLGSAVVHYYEKDGLNEETKQYFVACQTDVGKVNEGHADIGWKQLKTALMQSFGREEPRTRKN